MSTPASFPASEVDHLRTRLANSQRIAAIGDWEMDLAHQHLHWSAEIYRILDQPDESIAPDSELLYRQIHPDDLEFVHRQKLAVTAPPYAVRFEHRLVRQSGEVRYIQQRLEMVFEPKGQAKRIIGTLQDVTEQKRNELQAFRGQRMETIGALSSGIVHDLNNVLNPIQIAAGLLLPAAADPQTVRLLEMILGCSKRGADLVKQILSFAHGSTAGRGVIRLDSLLEDTVNIVKYTFPEDIHLETAIDPGIPPLVGDPVQIHQVLLNLCTNARDAMPHGGALTISLAHVTIDHTFLSLAERKGAPGTYLLLSVKDSGTGMSPEVRAHIFDLFYTTKTPDRGNGLGLGNVQRIVESHGGFILVTSVPGCGSEFKVYFPVGEAAAEVTLAPESVPCSVGHGELILVVDDEAAVRNISQHLLELAGYRVVTASDGAQAVARCIEHASDLKLMITDLAMPIMDGNEAIMAARTIIPGLQIIVASGTDEKSRSTIVGHPEADASVAKPYSAVQLLNAVRSVLPVLPAPSSS